MQVNIVHVFLKNVNIVIAQKSVLLYYIGIAYTIILRSGGKDMKKLLAAILAVAMLLPVMTYAAVASANGSEVQTEPFAIVDGKAIINAASALGNSSAAWTEKGSDENSVWELTTAGDGVSINPDTGRTWLNTGENLEGAPTLNYKVSVANAGTYYLFVNMSAPNQDADSYHVKVDGQFAYTHAGPPMNGDKLWKSPGTAISLTAGEHTITIVPREDGFVVNQLVLTTNRYENLIDGKLLDPEDAEDPDDGNKGEELVETNGEIAFNAAIALDETDYYWTDEYNGDTWTLTESGEGVALLPDTGRNWTDTSGNLAGVSSLSYRIKITNAGTYYLFVNMSSPDITSDSYHVKVDGTFLYTHAGDPMNGDKVWKSAGREISLTAGYHTITIVPREDGFVINQLVLTKDQNKSLTDGELVEIKDSEEETPDPDNPDPQTPVLPGNNSGAKYVYLNEELHAMVLGRRFIASYHIAGDDGVCVLCKGLVKGEQQAEPVLPQDVPLAAGETRIAINAADALNNSDTAWTETTGSDTWKLTSDGYGLSIQPDTKRTWLNTDENLSGAPSLNYIVDISEDGTYYLFVNMSAPDADSDSYHVKIDGQFAYTHAGDTMNGDKLWRTAGRGIALSEGEHTVTIVPREDGFVISQLVLTTNQNLSLTDGTYVAAGVQVSEETASEETLYVRNEDDIIIDAVSALDESETAWTETTGDDEWTLSDDGYGLSIQPDTKRTWLNTDENLSGAPSLNYIVDISEDGTYYLFVNMSAPDQDSDSYHVKIDGEFLYTHAGDPMNGDKLWRSAGKEIELSAGEHTITIVPREDGFVINQIVITADKDASFKDGTFVSRDAEVTVPEEPEESEDDGAAIVVSEGDIVIDATIALDESKTAWTEITGEDEWILTSDKDGLSIQPDTKRLWNNTAENLSGAPSLNYRVTIENAGTYYLFVNMSAPDQDSDSYHVMVDGEFLYTHAGDPMNGDKLWRSAGKEIELSAGEHTITIVPREDGFVINRLVLTTDKDASFTDGKL